MYLSEWVSGCVHVARGGLGVGQPAFAADIDPGCSKAWIGTTTMVISGGRHPGPSTQVSISPDGASRARG